MAACPATLPLARFAAARASLAKSPHYTPFFRETAMAALIHHPFETHWRRTTLALLALGMACTRAAAADEPDAATQSAMQAVISQQLDALGHDDAEKAESFAAPGIKTKFPDPKDFVAMVHNSYAPLIQPRSTHFDKAGSNALGPMQAVTIVDKEGGAWTAIYTFEQVDGQWRINGCALVKEQSTTI